MGNSVQRNVKNIGDYILGKYRPLLSLNFEANKVLVNKLIEYEQTLSTGPSPIYDPTIQYDMKKLRNSLAGYITHKYNQVLKEEETDSYSSRGSHTAPRRPRKFRRKQKR